ncbi:hypothetical protein [Amycolatopsis rubida]|uniref:Uncharacterized protein n=1 Tax=Amycolatopsis rubida TaxID=112413 RepID=A0A1I5S066_9PSEU|nr:hypothetical protein [Amycolatopsis rubida]SFP64054.1 hypothetical protein SAMN05421854_106133 [Amycolatopsis rubida]
MSEWPSTVRKVDPPMPVWAGVRKLLVLGTEIRATVPAADRDRAPGAAVRMGAPLGWVTYQLVTGDEQWSRPVSHCVPAHLLRRRGPARRHQYGGYRPPDPRRTAPG